MKCRELIESLLDYVEEELEDDRRQLFDDHLDECSDCLNYLSSYLETLKLSKGAVVREEAESASMIPENFVNALVQAIPKDSS